MMARISNRATAGLLAAFFLLSAPGCSLLYELQPYRLQRLNRGTEGMQSGSDAYYSVKDPLPADAPPTNPDQSRQDR